MFRCAVGRKAVASRPDDVAQARHAARHCRGSHHFGLPQVDPADREGRRHAESKKDFKGWGKPSSLSDKRVKAIRKARHEKNRTLKDIAEEYGISVSYAHRLTNDEKRKQYNEAHKARQREKYAEAN